MMYGMKIPEPLNLVSQSMAYIKHQIGYEECTYPLKPKRAVIEQSGIQKWQRVMIEITDFGYKNINGGEDQYSVGYWITPIIK